MNPVAILSLLLAVVGADYPGGEKVQVKVEQKGDGFSYTIGDPTTGSSSFYNMGAGAQDIMSGLGSLPLTGFYGGSFGSEFPVSGTPYGPASAGPYPHRPAYEGHSGYSAPVEKEVPGTYQAGGEPASGMGGILPAGFSYHGTDGQSFLRQGDVPDFVISGEGKDSAGPAEKSFGRDKSFDPFQGAGPSSGSSGFLTNGFIGYGSNGGSQVGVLPIGGFAKREHGGHTIEEA